MITDHVAILLGHSLDVARLNKKKTRSDFYAQVAVPPSAAPAIAELVAAVYPGVALSAIEVNFSTNAQQAKPFPGVPADWFVFRMASQFAPELYEADGATRIDHTTARSKFFAGMKVRVSTSAWGWKNEFGKSGASFNLLGLMDAGQGGERLSIGNGANNSAAAFATHANPNAVPSNPTPAGTPAPAGNINPFAQAAPADDANPFAQAARAGNINPFAQA